MGAVTGPNVTIEARGVAVKENPVKRALQAGRPQIGTWLSLGSIAAARFMARAGFPWLTVDMEHTHTDIQTAAYMFGAIADAGCVPLARIPTGKHEFIKMVLDCGAMGIVAPMVMDAAEARAIVAACKYPPRGNRSVGGGMHAINFGATSEEYYKKADDEILVIIQAEHIQAVEIADEIYAVPGLDAVFVGPNDLACSMRGPDGAPPSKEAFEATLTRIRESAARCHLPSGLHVLAASDALRRAREGWQFIAVGSELKMMLESAGDIVRQIDPKSAGGDLAKY
jgi:4-hydroxy-2-oxoheptanedioate aldolase